ncbi:MAG: proA [Peptococcaceae bacterium]|uniref:Gamma-glutamyl phosphate reductase n=1 Tax=Thermanaerosceptrum fracticalcis TaxID=1712410 RepID=A0A7G6E289_THEFR|nr:glutamate-5-semialdehyde dehydrogenase [Thermanaerosceptrum fracticalcis]MBZ4653174.1 proA [Peptococcaceae bacterium]QNB46193.1 glutamate-5-semialdehyde dehydrogenase [Thermanaerosceptrum fracticalcis]
MLCEELKIKGQLAKEASILLSTLSTETKNQALAAMAEALERHEEEILAANQKDIDRAKEKGIGNAMLDRLLLTPSRIKEMAHGLRALIALPDPVGEIEAVWKGAQAIEIGRMRVPLGVIGIIYEARPNVTVDAAGLCLKTGNAVILRGGSEALHSNITITRVISQAAESAWIPRGSIQLIENPDREVAVQLMKLNEYLDVLIPRGGAGLIQTVVQNSTVPVIETGIGNCHVYVDSEADLAMAEEIIINAKCQRPAVCNAAETLLVHEKVAADFIPKAGKRLRQLGVEIRGCNRTRALFPEAKAVTEEDYAAEFLDLILAVKVVDSLDEALQHIRTFGTKHSEAIVTESYRNSRRFLKEVDAAAVYVNASTRFTDGFQFGFGAEIGISTQKLHARGPMGLKELTTIKYVIQGDGQVRK